MKRSTSSTVTILAVGHCTPDAWMLRGAVDRALGADAVFEAIGEESALRDHLTSSTEPTVLLVNRRLDGWFQSEDGISLLTTILESGRPEVTGLLVSDLPEAQAAAEAIGARPGFGKREIHASSTLDTLRAAADASRARDA